MNDAQVSIDGSTHVLPKPFFVIATQNPQDFSGTFPLPESQLDRFMMRVHIGYPPPDVETRLLLGDSPVPVRTNTVISPATLSDLQADVLRVTLDAALAEYLHALIHATRNSPNIALGASTRAGMHLARAARARALLNGRSYCIADDIHQLALPVLSHRIRLGAHSDGYAPSVEETREVLQNTIGQIPVPL